MKQLASARAGLVYAASMFGVRRNHGAVLEQRRLLRCTLLGLLVSSASMLCVPVGAQEVDADTHARSNALFEAGRRSLADGNIADACESFSQSYQLEPRGGTLLNLGLCHEQQGLLLAARRELMEALALARRDGRADREPIALEHIASVESRLAWLSIAAPAGATAQSLTVRVDGQAIVPEAHEAVPVEAGEHVVSVEAPGHGAQQTKLTVLEGERVSVPVQLQPITPLMAAASPRPPAPALAVRGEPAARPFATARNVALIVGLVGITTTLVLGAVALDKKATLADHCNGKTCDETGLDAAEAGRVLTVATNVAFATGVASLSAWLVLPGGWLNVEQPREHALGVMLRGAY